MTSPLRIWAWGHRMFYAGPAVFNYPGRKIVGYRSPTVLAWMWLKSWALSWFTSSGRILLALAGMVGVTGMMSDLMPVYYLSFLLLGLFVVDYIVGRLFCPKFEFHRELPLTAVVGVPFVARYRIRAASKRPAWNIHLDTMPPPIHMAFVDGGLQLDTIPKEELTLQRELVVSRRGRYHLPLAVADSAFPFGLWRAGCRAPANAPILALPAFRPLQHMLLPNRGGMANGGDTTASGLGDSMNFRSCREYRYGDNPRHLHARAWARLGSPVVKEFSNERALRIAILLDLRTPDATLRQYLERELLGHANQRFEALIILTAAVADYVIRQGGSILLYMPHIQPTAIVPRDADAMREVLSVLAVLDPTTTDELHLSKQAEIELKSQSGFISLSAVADQRWHDLNSSLSAGPEACLPIAVSDRQLPSSDACINLRAKDLLGGEVASINRP